MTRRTRCWKTEKVRFDSEAEARAELAETAKKAAKGLAHRREQRCYPCLTCGGWHLTSRVESQ